MNEKIKSHWPLTLFSSLSAVCNLAVPLVLVRVFTDAEVGYYKLFFLYLALMPWLSLSGGVGNGLYLWAGKPDFKKYFHSSWTLLVCWSLFISVLLAIFLRNESWGLWFALGSFLTVLSTFHEDALVASGRTWRGGLFSASLEMIRTGLVLWVAVATKNMQWLIAVYVLSLSAKVILGFYFGRALNLQKFTSLWGVHKETSLTVLRYVTPVSIASLLAVFAHYADQLVLSRMVDVTYFAGYTLGCLTIPPLNSFEQAVNRVLIPSLTQKTPHLFRDAVAELSWILIPATVGLLVFADPIIQLVFTERYAWVSIFLRLYSFNYLLLAFPYDAWARAEGNGKWILKNLLITAIIGVILIPILTYFYMGVGALVGLLVTQVSLRVGAYLHIRQSTDWKPSEFLPLSEIFYQLGLCAVLSVLCFGAGSFLGFGFRWLIICAPLFAVIYLSLTTQRRLRKHFKERRKPAVLQMTQYIEMGGLERVIYSLCTSYQNHQSIDPYVLSYDIRPAPKSIQAEFEKIGVPVYALQKGKGFSFKVVMRIIRICYLERIGLLHTHDLGPLLYAAIAKTFTFGALKIVHTQHSFVHLAKKKRHQLYEKIFTRFADELIVVSPDARKSYQELGVNSVTLVQNGVFFPARVPETETEKASAKTALAPQISNDFWFLYLARIHSQKGQVHALELWKNLSSDLRENTVLVFVGQESSEGELKKLNDFIQKNHLEKNVLFAGMTTEPMRWLEASDAFISLSEFEGMPLSPMEAYGTGLPLILSQIPGHDLLPSDSLRIHRPATADDLKKVESLISEVKKSSATTRKESFHLASEWRAHYGIDQMAARYLKIYAKVTS